MSYSSHFKALGSGPVMVRSSDGSIKPSSSEPAAFRRVAVVYLSSKSEDPTTYCYETDLPVHVGDIVKVPATWVSDLLAPDEPNSARVVSLDSDYSGEAERIIGILEQVRA